MQRTKSKLLSILLSLVMLLSLLPTTAFAAGNPDPTAVFVDEGKSFYNGRLYYKSGDDDKNFSGNKDDYIAHYDPDTGTLTLNGYSGGSISVGGVKCSDITVVLKGTNTINGSLENAVGGDITVTSSDGGTLSISKTTSGSNSAIGIETGLSASYTTGNVRIKGNAKVTINMTHNGTSTYEKAYGIFAKQNITISENASVDITCATPNNTTGGGNCNGLYAAKDVTIDTNGTIKIDVTNAGKDKDNGYSYGVYHMSTATLTKVGNMEVQWKKEGNSTRYSGGAFTKGATFSDTDHAINEDTTNCYASYRFGTPYYTVTAGNGKLTGPGVKYPNGNGKFLVGDTVNIKPNEKKSSDGTLIPFKEWTSEGVALASPTTPNTSFNVPTNDVTVTATYNPFDGAPVFTRTSDSSGTIKFKTVANPDNSEFFEYVKDGETAYNRPYSQPTTTSSASPYEYSLSVSTYYVGDIKNLEAGDYRMAVTLNGERYLSEKFTVNYTAPVTPTANISLDKTSTVDFGSKEAGYTTAPAAEIVTITNSGTAATGALTIALDDATNFTLSKDNISDIAANSTDTFTVQPNIGLPAGIYTATVKVGGTGVTEQSFTVKFTVTAPLTGIAVPTAKTGLVYDGTEQTGVNESAGYTLGGTYKATDVGATDYAATATLDAGYKWNDGTTGDKTITWNIGKRTPTVADFVFAPPTDLTYDGNNKTAGVTLNSPLMKSGAINVKYEKDGAAVTEIKDVGEYTVKIDVAGGDNFEAKSDLTASAWKFSITPADQNAPTGLGVAAPTTSSGNGKITGTNAAMEYNTDAAATSGWTVCSATETEVAPGTYYVRFKADSNHNAGAAATVTVPGYSATKYTVTVTSDANGTASADKTINVAAGETVTLTATPKTGYVFDKWDNKTPASLTIDTDGKFNMPSENVSVKATFKPAALTGMASITGTAKFGEELTATLTGGNNTGNLNYTWYQNGTTQVAANNTGKYTLTADDIDKTITVKITSDVQTGEITSSATGIIKKADGPAAPSVTSIACTNSSNNDGKITGVNTTMEYSTVSDFSTKTACTGSEITGLANGTYYVRVAETTTHKAGTAATVNVPAYTPGVLTVATPTFMPNGASSFTGTQSVTISCATADATIYYTTDGTDPTASSTKYTTALSLTSTTTVKAIAVKAGMNSSATATATFTKKTGGGGGYYYAPTAAVVPDMPMLYRGCTGDAVKTLQDKLNALGYNSGNVDGIFGAKTYAAVTAFQKANSLGVDGIVGKLTWGKIYGVSPAMPVETTTVVGRPMVSYGSRGDAVRKLQELLNALGYDCGSVDGIFGSKTKAAVLAFQKANGLGVDGIVGPLTWAKLD